MSIFDAIIQGIVQGLTEFLPVSSSGHLTITQHVLGSNAGESNLFFNVMLHIGTLVAILITFYRPIYELFEEFFRIIKDISSKKFNLRLKDMTETRRMFIMFFISCVPLLILLIPIGNGKNIMDAVGVFSADNSIKAEGICFMLTGFVLLLGTFTSEKTKRFMKITPVSALLIGVAQFFAACFPGISRSGSTISTGLMCKVSKKNAVRYSFILSVPAILASGLVEFKDAMEGAQVVPVFPLLVGIVTSAVVGVFAIRLLQVIITKNIFKYFGFYCLGLGFVVTIIGAIEVFVK
jgi:undecaprenyl-diphosphatase